GSQLYRSKAVGPPQPDFVNAALHLVDCPFEPLALVQRLLQIEQTLGRVRQTRWAPRNLDLDLLWADEVISHEPAAIVPHPRLKERAFALRPLLDLVPLAHDPLTNTAYQTIFEALGPQDLHRI